MKQLTCEMCGSTELIKQDGFFVCQTCGCKYSVEEAKRMMIEGTVAVQGTVKVDNSSFVEKYLSNARRALNKTDWGEAKKYYNMVEQNVPDNIEAIFFSAYSQFRKDLFDIDTSDRSISRDILVKSISVISDYFETTKEDKKAVLKKMTVYIKALKEEKCVKVRGQFGVSTSKMLNGWYNIIADAFLTELKQIAVKHNDSYIQALIQEIQATQTTGGCYVATCVYGSYDCPEVWTLRRYRDNTLGSTWYGRAFIRTYYAISPTLVKWFGKTKWFKKMWKGTLDKMVNRLQDKGIESTPYSDKDWQ